MIIYRELLNGEKEGLLKLPTDLVLLSDPAFRPLVDKYAAVCIFFDHFVFFPIKI